VVPSTSREKLCVAVGTRDTANARRAGPALKSDWYLCEPRDPQAEGCVERPRIWLDLERRGR
jgi:hypothetical protein